MKQIRVGKGDVFTLVDDSDFIYLSQFTWGSIRGYVRRVEYCNKKQTSYLIHREILKPKFNEIIDHINGNILDNRRENLRICNKSQNAMNCKTHKHNTSGYKGVSWHKNLSKWRAYIMIENKQKHLGLFDTKEEAAISYNNAATNLFGVFAKINIIELKE